MKRSSLLAALTVTTAIGIVGPACAQHEEGQQQQQQGTASPGGARQPGGAMTMMTTGTATVKSVDRQNRTVTLQRPDGSTATYKCGKQMVNFDQIKEGDQVRATLIERLAVSVGKPGAEAAGQPAEAGMVALAPKGAKPGIILADTDVKQYTISSVDQRDRTVTVTDKDGKSETIKVAPDVDLTGVQKGDDVTLRYTQGLALVDEKGAAEAAPGEAQPAGARIRPGEGAEGIETATASATVESVDPAARTVTLKGDNGQTRTIHLGKEARNFDQIHPGDKVRATLAEEMAVDVTKGRQPPRIGHGVVMARTPKGAKPGMLIGETTVISGKVDSVDPDQHTLTLTEPGGTRKTLKVAPRVDLSQLQSGDDVNARVTQALGIVVEKP